MKNNWCLQDKRCFKLQIPKWIDNLRICSSAQETNSVMIFKLLIYYLSFVWVHFESRTCVALQIQVIHMSSIKGAYCFSDQSQGFWVYSFYHNKGTKSASNVFASVTLFLSNIFFQVSCTICKTWKLCPFSTLANIFDLALPYRLLAHASYHCFYLKLSFSNNIWSLYFIFPLLIAFKSRLPCHDTLFLKIFATFFIFLAHSWAASNFKLPICIYFWSQGCKLFYGYPSSYFLIIPLTFWIFNLGSALLSLFEYRLVKTLISTLPAMSL